MYDFLVRRIADAVANHPTIRQINTKLNTIMADQDKLDSDVQAIGTDFAAAVHAEATADAP